jgi:hypothetical protein
MNSVLQFEENVLLHFAGLFVRAAIGLVVLVAWSIFRAAIALFALWRPVATVAGIVGAVALCAAVPALPVGLGVVAIFAVATMPRTAVRNGR